MITSNLLDCRIWRIMHNLEVISTLLWDEALCSLANQQIRSKILDSLVEQIHGEDRVRYRRRWYWYHIQLFWLRHQYQFLLSRLQVASPVTFASVLRFLSSKSFHFILEGIHNREKKKRNVFSRRRHSQILEQVNCLRW